MPPKPNPEMSGSYYKRNLPHWHPESRLLFVTWRLFGSLPANLAKTKDSGHVSPGRRFQIFDAALDKASKGPFWLSQEHIASLVADSLHRGATILKQYVLHAYVIMPNHVHILLEPRLELQRITQGFKGTTGRKANQALSRIGKPFWQDESFDHWVRSESEYVKIHNYILRNPVSAGLVKNALDWQWSSANEWHGLTVSNGDSFGGTAS